MLTFRAGLEVLSFVLSLHTHPYFVFAISRGSGESAHTTLIKTMLTFRVGLEVLSFVLGSHMHSYEVYAISRGSGESAHTTLINDHAGV